MRIKLARRAVQLAVILFIIFVALFNLYGFLKSDNRLKEVKAPLHRAAFSVFDAVASRFFETDDYLNAALLMEGSTWGFRVRVLGTVADPLAVISTILAGKVLYLPLLSAAALPLLFTLLFGRAFCGWLCPMNTLLEGIDALRMRFPLPDIKFDRGAKYYVLIAGLLLAFAGLPVFHWIYPPVLLSQVIFSSVYYLTLGSGAAIIFAIAAFEFFVSRRAWCRYFCPGGALLSWIASKGFMRVEASKQRCKPLIDTPNGARNCMECRKACMLALDPISKRYSSECNMCGECIAACPQKAANYSFSAHSLVRRLVAVTGEAR